MRCAGCVPPAACDGARAGEITAKNGLYYLACYRLITDVTDRITQSQSSIYEFLFPEIPLCLYTSYIVYESTISEYIYPGAVPYRLLVDLTI